MSRHAPNTQDGNGRTLLHLACQDDDVAPVKQLVERGEDPLISDVVGLTPVHLAIREGNAKVLTYLLGKIKDHNFRDPNNGGTFLHFACQVASVQIITMLLKAGVDPNAIDGGGWPTLAFACGRGDLEIVTVLLDHGAKIDAQNRAGVTVLQACASSGDRKLCELLLARGADPERADDDEKKSARKWATAKAKAAFKPPKRKR